MSASYSEKHPHEKRGVPPALRPDGGCEVCALEVELDQCKNSWRLIERYVAHYPDVWACVFRRDEDVIVLHVPEDIWRAFDRFPGAGS